MTREKEKLSSKKKNDSMIQQFMKIVQVDDKAIDAMVRQSMLMQKPEKQQQRVTWRPSFTLQSLSLPEIAQSARMTKKFRISLTYKDQIGTVRHKTIYFGNGDEYAFTKNINIRLKKLQSAKYIKNRGDLLSPEYWQTTLLQMGQDFVKNTQQVVKNYLEYVWKKGQIQKTRIDYGPVIQKRMETIKRKNMMLKENTQ